VLVVEALFPDAAFVSTQEGIGEYSFEDLSENNPGTWSWDFGDGTNSTEQNPTHQFLQDGVFEVCLLVSNDFGQDSTCQSFTITNLQPKALFTQDSIGQGAFQFFNQSSDNSTTYSWDFGDETNSSEQNPTHQFFKEGDFNVCLIAQNEFSTDTFCMALQVRNLIPKADFILQLLTSQGQDSLYFFDASTNLPTSWRWDFGDGTTSLEQNPRYRYTASGLYLVCLVASNTFGTDSTCQEVNFILSDVLQEIVESGLQVSPNPFQNNFQIDWQGMVPKTVLLYEIFNTQGQQMGSRKHLQASQVQTTENWPAGSYWLQVKTQSGRLVKSFSLLKQ
jgi:PKD repeat protein